MKVLFLDESGDHNLTDDWLIVEEKLRRGPGGEMEGYGLVSLPK